MSKKFGIGTCKSAKYSVASDGISSNRKRSSSRSSSTNKVKIRNKKVRVEYIDIGSCSEDSDDSGKSSESISSSTSSSHNSSYSSSGSEQFRDSSPEDVKQLTKKRDRRVNEKAGRKKKVEEDSEENEASELDHEEFCVEKIMDMKVEPSGKFYFVKWLNYDETDNTWEPESNLEKCQDAIDEYLAEQKKKLAVELEPGSHVKTSKSTERKQKKPANLTGRSKKISRQSGDMEDIRNKIKSTAVKVVKKYRHSSSTPSSFSLITPDASRSPSSTMEVDTPSPTNSFDSVDSDFDSRSSNGSIENELPPTNSSEDVNVLIPCRSSPSPILTNPDNHVVNTNGDLDWLETVIKPSEIVRLRQPGNLFYFRIIKDGKIDWLYVDIDEGGRSNAVNSDEFYVPINCAFVFAPGQRCVVTEDLTGKDPKLIYGATKGEDGEIFCLVQFEGCSYVDVIPPQNLFQKYPSFKKFFEMHCPRIFPKEELSKF